MSSFSKNKPIASSGVSTIGSPRPFREVFTKIGNPAIFPLLSNTARSSCAMILPPSCAPSKPPEEGDVDTQFAKGGKIFEAQYYVPHLAHAIMEPPVAVAEVRGNKATVWAPTQNSQGVQESVAQALDIRKEDATCHVTLLGGGFGRKSFHDFAD